MRDAVRVTGRGDRLAGESGVTSSDYFLPFPVAIPHRLLHFLWVCVLDPSK